MMIGGWGERNSSVRSLFTILNATIMFPGSGSKNEGKMCSLWHVYSLSHLSRNLPHEEWPWVDHPVN